jgi:plastocyanin
VRGTFGVSSPNGRVTVRWAGVVVALTVVIVAVAGAGEPTAKAAPVWVVSAVDYHFHDAHPTPRLALNETLVVINYGMNSHNVTIPGIGYSANVAPGKSLVIRNLGARLGGNGRYFMYCAYHRDLGMKGTIVIAPPGGPIPPP